MYEIKQDGPNNYGQSSSILGEEGGDGVRRGEGGEGRGGRGGGEGRIKSPERVCNCNLDM